jgi:hypothetical protein
LKSTRQLITVLFLALLAWSCEKEAKFNRIEGTLSPGLDISRSHLDSVPVVMAKIWDTLDFSGVNTDSKNFEEFYAAIPDAGGYFHFDSLPDGNYLVAAGEGFTFADVDYVKVSLSGGSTNQVNKTVNRVPLPNGPTNYFVGVRNETSFDISLLEFFVNGISLGPTDLYMSTEYRECITCHHLAYYDWVLDPDQNPYFRLSVIRNDTVASTPFIPFFHSIFGVYNCYLLSYNRWVDGKAQANDLYFEKSWFFGHHLRLYRVEK